MSGDRIGDGTWVIVPAAGSGTRFGGERPKQYVQIGGRPLIAHTLSALLRHPRIAGAMVALAAQDTHWAGWQAMLGKPILRCDGGATRARSVLAGLRALPAQIGPRALVLVHDAARPILHPLDIDRLLEAAEQREDGAILAAPVRDTLKRCDADGRIAATQPREGLWRALTPQAFRRGLLTRALQDAEEAGVDVTDEAMAVERFGLHPALVEGREDNLKVTTPADLALAEFLLGGGR